jgi:hypothetical protein
VVLSDISLQESPTPNPITVAPSFPGMDWQKLDLSKASLVKKEVDNVITRLIEISNNPGEVDKTILVNTVQARIQELENFYLKNSDDERAVLFEKERLRLRKALQPFYGSSSSKDNRSVSASDAYDKSGHESITSKTIDRMSTSQLTRSKVHSSSQKSLHSLISGQGKLSSSRSLKSSSLSPGHIYAWEERSEKVVREVIEMHGAVFEPTQVKGLYNRQMNREEEEEFLSDKYIDVQIILTQDEIATLAARKRVERPDKKLFKSECAATSVHTSTPYVDPSRIRRDMFRPGHPDRWLGGTGFV